MLRPGDYKPAPEGIQRMFGGFAADRVRIRSRSAMHEAAHPSVQTSVDLSGSTRPLIVHPEHEPSLPFGGRRQRG